MTYRTPSKEGFFWGRWHTAAPDTEDDGEAAKDNREWEVHHVVDNYGVGDERLMAMVPGVSKWQPLSNFEWGPEVYRPSRLAKEQLR